MTNTYKRRRPPVAIVTLAALFMLSAAAAAQESTNARPADGLEYKVEMQASVSDGYTPLWLNANKHGLSSVEESNGYLRAAAERKMSVDDGRKWGLGYALDMAVAYNYTSTVVVQQAYVEGRWWHGTLSIGSKERPMELKNSRLSSGSQTLGTNARPVPQVRIALDDYWTIPALGRWFSLKGHIAYGKMTDDEWQKDFTNKESRYNEDVLYHSKAGYLRIGKSDGRHPLSVEIGLEMASQFGGRCYRPNGDGTFKVYENRTNLGAYWNALIAGGSETGETTYQNVEGNHLGSWVARVSWDAPTWCVAVYADHYFEDHSSMLFLDYDGYGTGENWDVKEDNDYFLYDLKDIMLGAELNLKKGRWLRNVVFEYLYTKYQCGPIYHDHSEGVSTHICGKDNYYNHNLYGGWQHWGMVMGNALYRSPIYNTDGTIMVQNNRFMAFHLGFDGQPTQQIGYRVLASWQDGLGTYMTPYKHIEENVSMMAEVTYTPTCKTLRGWQLTAAAGFDSGDILGDNSGFQLTIRKTGLLNFKRRARQESDPTKL